MDQQPVKIILLVFKKAGILLSIILLPAVILFSCKKEAQQPILTEIKNIPYGSMPQQDYDIVFPIYHDTKTKTIILVHGGGWTGGDKEDFLFLARKLAERGFAAASVNYRFASNTDNVHYQEMINDIGLAIDFISSKSGEYKISGNDFGMLGHSAGGHLSLLYTYKKSLNNKVRAVISVSGATDLLDEDLLLIPGMYSILLQLTGDTSKAKWQDASPVGFVTQHTAATYLIHGKSDAVIPYNQSVTLFNILKSSGVNAGLMLIENRGHDLTNQDYNEIMDSLIVFYKGYLNREP